MAEQNACPSGGIYHKTHRYCPDCDWVDEQDASPEAVEGQAPARCCVTCGAVITEGTTRMHNHWHAQLDAALAANRPDPRSAFIGG